MAGRDGTAVGVSRRTVTRAAAWTVPVISVVAQAPAFAASCATLVGVGLPSWNGTISSNGRTWSQTYAPPTGQTVTLTISASYSSDMAPGSETPGGPALFDVVAPVGGTGKPGLGLIQTVTTTSTKPAPGRNARGTYSFSFSRPVTNLAFTLTDVDRTPGDFADRVELSGGWTETSRGAGVTGSGTQADPWVGAAAYDDGSSAAGNLQLSFAGPVSSFTLTYWNAETQFSGVDRNQAVFLADLTFDYQPC